MADLAKIVEELSTLTVMEAAELSKMLEETWGVTAAAPVAAAGVAVSAEEKTDFDIKLTEIGGNKIAVIKEVRAITGLGLKEAKEMVDAAPSVIKESASASEAEEIKTKLEAAGATVELA